MLSYQHGYHAGNFADVHKHTALYLLMKHFYAASKLVTFIDSHSGRGLYDLTALQAQKTGEWKDGIGKLIKASPKSQPICDYLDTVKTFDENTYPGSPALMSKLMAANHRALFFELHPAEFAELEKNIAHDKRAKVIHENAMDALINYLPARKNEGLLLVDPSYEVKEEYSTIARLVNQVHKRWPTGIKMVWYPLLPQGRHEDLKAALKDATFYELIGPKKERGMYGTGLALINAPEGFAAQFSPCEQEMAALLF